MINWGTATNAYHDQKDAIADRKERRLKSRVANMKAFNDLVSANPDADPNYLVNQYVQMGLDGDPRAHVDKLIAHAKAERQWELQQRQYAQMEQQQKFQTMADQFVAGVAPKAKSYNELEQMVVGRFGESEFSKNALTPARNNFTDWRKNQMSNWITSKASDLKNMDYNQRATVVKNTWGDDASDVLNGYEEQRTNEFYSGLIPDLKQFVGVEDDKLEAMLKGRARLAGFNPDFVRADAFRDAMEPFQHQVITGLQREYDGKVEKNTQTALTTVDKEIQEQAKNLKPVIGELNASDNLKSAALVIASTYKLRSPQSITDVLRYMETKKHRYESMYSQDIAADVINNIKQGNVKGISKNLIQTPSEAAQEKARAQIQGYRPTDSFAKHTAPVVKKQIQQVSLDNFYDFAHQKLSHLAPQDQSQYLEVMKARYAREIDNEITRLTGLSNDSFSNGLRSDEDKAALNSLVEQLNQIKTDLKAIALDDTKLNLDEPVVETTTEQEQSEPPQKRPTYEEALADAKSGNWKNTSSAMDSARGSLATDVRSGMSKLKSSITRAYDPLRQGQKVYRELFVDAMGREPVSNLELTSFIQNLSVEKPMTVERPGLDSIDMVD